MEQYEYGRIRKLDESMKKAGIAPEVIAEVMAGGGAIKKSAKPELKAAWLAEAMERLDALLDEDTRRTVREACACCLGGKRLAIAKGIARDYETLEERIQAANEAHYVFGHGVTRAEDGSFVVQFDASGKESYHCVCLPKAKLPVSATYCMCCGGHVKHHLQIALGRELTCVILSSALSTGGKETCRFRFRTIEE